MNRKGVLRVCDIARDTGCARGALIFYVACVALSLFACDRSKQVETAHPLVKIEVISLPFEGTVISVCGPVSVKERQSSTYVPISPNQVINPGDVIELRKGGSLGIRFVNGTTAVIEAGSADRWVMFKRCPPENQRPQATTGTESGRTR
jgi:hypothetical protein